MQHPQVYYLSPKNIFPILSDSVFHLSPVAPNSPLPLVPAARKVYWAHQSLAVTHSAFIHKAAFSC